MDNARKAKRRERIRMICAALLVVLAVTGIVQAVSGGVPVYGVLGILWLFLAAATLGDIIVRRRRQNAAAGLDRTPEEDPWRE